VRLKTLRCLAEVSQPMDRAQSSQVQSHKVRLLSMKHNRANKGLR
jgi:hypothetical protein